ncbi:hypothetical protein B5M44_14100 [Shinella sumterensis]|uniref:hypothetical protein n=1 Tax=Shinella sumterensis TaxID=1967501 RepID=UPI00106DF12E|nr:hypothetical protein [Shinella sumterensis]MCD1264265.1 hypothetical protein [Shinella sumterensis]TFE97734.1 hypothetical protein B5M44_14100 [Shinella sumterensis]
METMHACLPAGTPLSFTLINAAFKGKNRIVADVVMFDDAPATLVLSRWAHGWSHTFENLIGGDVSFEDGRWMRIDRATLLPIATTDANGGPQNG